MNHPAPAPKPRRKVRVMTARCPVCGRGDVKVSQQGRLSTHPRGVGAGWGYKTNCWGSGRKVR